MSFETLSSKTIYRGRVINVRQDQVRLPDGGLAYLDIVEHKGAVTLLPVDGEGQIWFVRQYRHATGQVLLELPAGVLADNEDPQACALRELREETGMAAERLRKKREVFIGAG